MRFTSSIYRLASQVKLSTAKKIYLEMHGWFLEACSVMTNFRAKVTNSFANGTNSIAKATNSIAKTCISYIKYLLTMSVCYLNFMTLRYYDERQLFCHYWTLTLVSPYWLLFPFLISAVSYTSQITIWKVALTGRNFTLELNYVIWATVNMICVYGYKRLTVS